MDRRTLLGGAAGSVLIAGAALVTTTRPLAPPRATGIGDRWVSLSPAITETVFALGRGARLVGRSTYCHLPPEAIALPEAGTALTPDYEALAALAPTGVFVDDAVSAQIDRVARIAPVHPLPWLTLADVVASVGRLGDLLAVDASALQQRFGDTLTETAPSGGPRVLLLMAGDDLGRGPAWFIKRDSLHGAALHGAGWGNAVDREVDGLPQLPLEALVALDPDVIVVLSASPVDDAARSRLRHAFDALTPLSAPSAGRVGVLAGPQVLSVGPSILELPALLGDEVRRLLSAVP